MCEATVVDGCVEGEERVEASRQSVHLSLLVDSRQRRRSLLPAVVALAQDRRGVVLAAGESAQAGPSPGLGHRRRRALVQKDADELLEGERQHHASRRRRLVDEVGPQVLQRAAHRSAQDLRRVVGSACLPKSPRLRDTQAQPQVLDARLRDETRGLLEVAAAGDLVVGVVRGQQQRMGAVADRDGLGPRLQHAQRLTTVGRRRAVVALTTCDRAAEQRRREQQGRRLDGEAQPLGLRDLAQAPVAVESHHVGACCTQVRPGRVLEASEVDEGACRLPQLRQRVVDEAAREQGHPERERELGPSDGGVVAGERST